MSDPDYSAFRLTIVGCARCQGDGHDDVWWEPLTHPVTVDTSPTVETVVFTHWAPCPTNGQPILMRTDAPTPPASTDETGTDR